MEIRFVSSRREPGGTALTTHRPDELLSIHLDQPVGSMSISAASPQLCAHARVLTCFAYRPCEQGRGTWRSEGPLHRRPTEPVGPASLPPSQLCLVRRRLPLPAGGSLTPCVHREVADVQWNPFPSRSEWVVSTVRPCLPLSSRAHSSCCSRIRKQWCTISPSRPPSPSRQSNTPSTPTLAPLPTSTGPPLRQRSLRRARWTGGCGVGI